MVTSSRAIDSDPRLQKMYRKLQEQQDTLAAVEARQHRELLSTRSKLDSVTCRLDKLVPARASAADALAHVMEQTRQCPQRALSDWGGWSSTESTAVREVYALNTAQRIANTVAASRGEVAPEVGSLPPAKQGRRVTMAEWETAQLKRAGKL